MVLAVLSYIPLLYDVTQRGVFYNSLAYNEKYPIPLKQLQSLEEQKGNSVSLKEKK